MALADEPLSWLKMPIWWLGNKENGYVEVHQKKLAQRNQKWIVQINGNQSPEKALDFVGLFLGAPLDKLPKLSDNEFYWEELVGMRVFLQSGDLLGEVAELLESPANAVLVVKNGEKTHLLPFVKSVVIHVLREEKRIIVDWGKDW